MRVRWMCLRHSERCALCSGKRDVVYIVENVYESMYRYCVDGIVMWCGTYFICRGWLYSNNWGISYVFCTST